MLTDCVVWWSFIQLCMMCRLFLDRHPTAVPSRRTPWHRPQQCGALLPPEAGAVAQYVPLFYRVQRPLLRGAVADRDSIARLRNLLLDFHSACYELKRDQQALSILRAAMQRQGVSGDPSRDALKQLEVSCMRHPQHITNAYSAWPCLT